MKDKESLRNYPREGPWSGKRARTRKGWNPNKPCRLIASHQRTANCGLTEAPYGRHDIPMIRVGHMGTGYCFCNIFVIVKLFQNRKLRERQTDRQTDRSPFKTLVSSARARGGGPRTAQAGPEPLSAAAPHWGPASWGSSEPLLPTGTGAGCCRAPGWESRRGHQDVTGPPGNGRRKIQGPE